MNAGWEAIPTAEGSHVVPVDDLIVHDLTPCCQCGPEFEHVAQEDGSHGSGCAWMTTHHSLDNREAKERLP